MVKSELERGGEGSTCGLVYGYISRCAWKCWGKPWRMFVKFLDSGTLY